MKKNSPKSNKTTESLFQGEETRMHSETQISFLNEIDLENNSFSLFKRQILYLLL